jgi:hypothetical protein
VFDARELGRVYGSQREREDVRGTKRKLHFGELHNLYFEGNIISDQIKEEYTKEAYSS